MPGLRGPGRPRDARSLDQSASPHLSSPAAAATGDRRALADRGLAHRTLAPGRGSRRPDGHRIRPGGARAGHLRGDRGPGRGAGLRAVRWRPPAVGGSRQAGATGDPAAVVVDGKEHAARRGRLAPRRRPARSRRTGPGAAVGERRGPERVDHPPAAPRDARRPRLPRGVRRPRDLRRPPDALRPGRGRHGRLRSRPPARCPARVALPLLDRHECDRLGHRRQRDRPG